MAGCAWLAAASLAAWPLAAGTARAESNFVNGAGTATAKLISRSSSPSSCYLQVGTGTYPTTCGTVDTDHVRHVVAPCVDRQRYRAAATSGGDGTGPGTVTARVVGNNFTAATPLYGHDDGRVVQRHQHTISWSEILRSPTAATVSRNRVVSDSPGHDRRAVHRWRCDHGFADAGGPSDQPGRQVGVHSTRTRTSRRPVPTVAPAMRRQAADLFDRDALTQHCRHSIDREVPGPGGPAPRLLSR